MYGPSRFRRCLQASQAHVRPHVGILNPVILAHHSIEVVIWLGCGGRGR